MKFIYKPIGIFLGILGGLLGKRLFNFAWTKIDDEDPPKATTEYSPWVKIIGAAALQGVIFKVTRVVVDRYGAIGWTYLTGSWPGEKRPDPDDDQSSRLRMMWPRSRYSASAASKPWKSRCKSSCSGRPRSHAFGGGSSPISCSRICTSGR